MNAEEIYILRGLVKKDNSKVVPSNLNNYMQIFQKSVTFSADVQKILDFIHDYYKSTSGFPSIVEITSEFHRRGAMDIVTNLGTLNTLGEVDEATFSYNLKKHIQHNKAMIVKGAAEQVLSYVTDTLPTAKIEEDVAEKAMEIMNQRAWELFNTSSAGVFTNGDLSDHSDDFKKRVNQAMVGESLEVIPTGVTNIDTHIEGIRRGDLAFVCGFTGAFKTGACVNWALSAMQLGYNVLYITMENSAEQLVNQIISSHAASNKFRHLNINPPSHTDIAFGNLTPDQVMLIDTAYQDYNMKMSTGEYGHLYVNQPETAEVTLSSIKQVANYFNVKCDNQLDMIVLDSPGLLVPERYSSDQKASKNQIIRNLKLFALTFNRGKGVALLCPHQINREGHDRALKDEKKLYDHRCIADLNEIERSADVILTIFSDNEDLRVTNQLLVQFLKTRNFGAPKYQNYAIFANMATRRWGNLALDENINYEDNFDFNSELEEIVVGE